VQFKQSSAVKVSFNEEKRNDRLNLQCRTPRASEFSALRVEGSWFISWLEQLVAILTGSLDFLQPFIQILGLPEVKDSFFLPVQLWSCLHTIFRATNTYGRMEVNSQFHVSIALPLLPIG